MDRGCISVEILAQRLAHGSGQHRHVGVLGVGEADHHLGARGASASGPPRTAERRDLGVGEGDVDELHRGGLAGGAGAVQVGLGDAVDGRAADPDDAVSSTPPSLASRAPRRTGSSISNITVATSSRPLGISGL